MSLWAHCVSDVCHTVTGNAFKSTANKMIPFNPDTQRIEMSLSYEIMSERWRGRVEFLTLPLADLLDLTLFMHCFLPSLPSLALQKQHSAVNDTRMGDQHSSADQHRREVMTHFDLLLHFHTVPLAMFHSSRCTHPCPLCAKSLSLFVPFQPRIRTRRPS